MIKHHETLVAALDHSAERYPESKLYFSDLRSKPEVTYETVAVISQRYARGLQRLGVRKGDLVGLHLSTCPEFIFSFIGTIRAGGVPVPLPTQSGFQGAAGLGERLAHIIRHSGARYIISEHHPSEHLDDPLNASDRRWLKPAEIDAAGDGSLNEIRTDRQDLCFIQYTSGSTAAPKGVALTHANVLAGLGAIVDHIHLSAADIWCSWLPLYHDMGLIGMLCNMACGASLHLSRSRSFIGNPGAWLQAFSRCGGTLYAGPSFSYAHMLQHVDDEQLAALDLCRWRLAFNGSESINPQVFEQFIQRFAIAGFRASAMFPVYGMAEATLAVSFPALGSRPTVQWVDREMLADGRAVEVSPASPKARGVLSVGRAVPDHAVRVVGPQDTLPENSVGEVQVRGPAVMAGYYADLKESAAVLRNGWLATGDLGYLSGGLLFITGRLKEMIIVNGRKFYPQDVEQLLGDVAGIYKGRCLALGDDGTEQMILAVETDQRSPERLALINKLRSLISHRLGLFAVQVYLLKPGSIPRTSSGKQQRLLLRLKLRSGDLHDKLWPEADYNGLQHVASQAS